MLLSLSFGSAIETTRAAPLLRCVMSEDKIASFNRFVARKASFELRRVVRLAVFELRETPAARRGVLSRILDHELNVRG